MAEEIPEWEEIDEEIPPPSLEKKWEAEEREGIKAVSCPGCGKLNRGDALNCIYCDQKLIYDSGFLGWLIHLSTRSFVGFTLFVVFLIMLAWLFIY